MKIKDFDRIARALNKQPSPKQYDELVGTDMANKSLAERIAINEQQIIAAYFKSNNIINKLKSDEI